MKSFSCTLCYLLCSILPQISVVADPNTGVHTTWLWHLHQPVYWPDRRVVTAWDLAHGWDTNTTDHYENAWDTIQQQNAGRPHPSPEVLSTIFGEADRVNVYQGEIPSVISGLLSYPNAGAQVNYSGALMENVQSLASAGQLGYAPGWNDGFQTVRSWTTSGGFPRLDLVNFTYHHAIAPLLDDATLEMELRIQQRQMQIYWGTNVPLSQGYFPAEECFSERIIPILKKVGIMWTVIANNHLARACEDFPLMLGSGGENCDIPNPADQIDPAQGATNYQRVSIERGCAPTEVMPFGFQLHYARYVDPNTGKASTIIVVPSDQVLSWRDSYGTWDLGMIAPIAARNNPAHPSLVLLAHDGDNAWSGGYSYYNEWVPQMASTAAADGYEPTTIQQFIHDFPPATNDIIHVEDGGWVFADGDFGSPSFINWNWPPSYTDSNGNNVVDPSIGTSDKADNWRVIIATANRVETAQQISGITTNINLDQVRDPGSFGGTPTAVELGWHYYLASLDSGFVYYGCTGDECERAVIAQSNACRNVDAIIAAHPSADKTPPTVFLPQRSPWNPGATNFGVQYGYKVTVATNSDFWVWTYAYDVSGITNVSLNLREDGTNPPTSDQFKTYAGGPLTGAWQSGEMYRRVTPPVSGDTPEYIADYYYSRVTGISNAFVDYYISASDKYGNVYKSPIQHVWVGAGSGGGNSGGGAVVMVSPNPPVAGNAVTIWYNAAGRILGSASQVYIHLGWNNWNPVVSPDAAMTFNSASNLWEYTVAVPTDATNLNCVFTDGSGSWDNNNGANWNFNVSSGGVSQPPSQPQNLTATPVQTNQINLTWSLATGASGYMVDRDDAPIATTSGTNYSDTGLATDSYHCYSVVASNSVGFSTPSVTICTNTLAIAPTNVPPFVLDGTFDYPGYLLATNSGLALYAAVRGTTLYVATASPGTSGPNDNFIFVSDQLLPAAAPAPWAKAGTVAVASTKPYLASESQNSYISWYVNNAQTNWPCAKSSTSSGAMEGTMDLVQAFGYMPTNLYLCAAAYVTTNSGPLVAECPVGTGPNIGTNGFFVIPVVALRDSLGNGIFDLLDPARGFKILSVEAMPSTNVLNWAAMPGRAYQVQFLSRLDPVIVAWSNFLNGSNFAVPPVTILDFTDALPAGLPQRYYRVELLP